jgi:hypothetical protein
MRFRGTVVAKSPSGAVLSRKGFALTLAAMTPFLMAGAFLTSEPVQAALGRRPDPLSASPVPPTRVNNYPLSVAEDTDDAAVDLLGNPVNDAVAKYKFDAAGSLYELHSPQTELPRLKPPRS